MIVLNIGPFDAALDSQQSLKNNAREAINKRINQDPDFDAKKFPNAKNFASK